MFENTGDTNVAIYNGKNNTPFLLTTAHDQEGEPQYFLIPVPGTQQSFFSFTDSGEIRDKLPDLGFFDSSLSCLLTTGICNDNFQGPDDLCTDTGYIRSINQGRLSGYSSDGHVFPECVNLDHSTHAEPNYTVADDGECELRNAAFQSVFYDDGFPECSAMQLDLNRFDDVGVLSNNFTISKPVDQTDSDWLVFGQPQVYCGTNNFVASEHIAIQGKKKKQRRDEKSSDFYCNGNVNIKSERNFFPADGIRNDVMGNSNICMGLNSRKRALSSKSSSFTNLDSIGDRHCKDEYLNNGVSSFATLAAGCNSYPFQNSFSTGVHSEVNFEGMLMSSGSMYPACYPDEGNDLYGNYCLTDLSVNPYSVDHDFSRAILDYPNTQVKRNLQDYDSIKEDSLSTRRKMINTYLSNSTSGYRTVNQFIDHGALENSNTKTFDSRNNGSCCKSELNSLCPILSDSTTNSLSMKENCSNEEDGEISDTVFSVKIAMYKSQECDAFLPRQKESYKSGMRGVVWDWNLRCWVANWCDSTGKRVRRHFFAKVFGFEEAKILAVNCRKEAEDSGEASLPRPSSSGVRGVKWYGGAEVWVAYWQVNRKQCHKWFSVRKYGYHEALHMAIQYRKHMEHKYYQ